MKMLPLTDRWTYASQVSMRSQGWSIQDREIHDGWVVTGTKEKQVIIAIGSTRQEAWSKAVEQSKAGRSCSICQN